MRDKCFVFSHRGALGDFLLTWPVLRALRNHYGTHRFIGLGKPAYLELAKKFKLVDEFHDCESKNLLSFYQGASVPEFLQPLDIVLAWIKWEPAFENLLTKFCGTKYLIHPPFPEAEDRHMSEHHGDILPALGVEAVDDWDYYFPIPAQMQKTFFIHPGSGCPDKNFGPDFYLFIADELKNSGFAEVEFILGPAETRYLDYFEGKYHVLKSPKLCALAEAISGSRLYIGNDSGPSHLAGLLGVQTLALYKSTSPLVWGVKGPNAVNIEAPTATLATAKIMEFLSRL
jgi:ADP-heptose:LPS heptosyltransferase